MDRPSSIPGCADITLRALELKNKEDKAWTTRRARSATHGFGHISRS